MILVQDADLLEENRMAEPQHPLVIVVDPQGIYNTPIHVISRLRKKWPDARFVVLVDSWHHSPDEQGLGVEYILSKSSSASDLISVVKHLGARESPPVGAWSVFQSTSPVAFK
jgi:DNA-binding NarL/FixJ family response regulator